MSKSTWIVVCGATSLFAVSRPALATADPPAAYDARSVGMGGTGVAFIHNGSSIFHNPATLEGIHTGAATLVYSPMLPTLTTPLLGPNTATKSNTVIGPLFLAGGGYRLHERLVVGAAVYPTAGTGSAYGNFPGGGDLKMAILSLEAAPAASFLLAKGLSLGIAYRMTHVSMSQTLPTAMAGGSETSLSGTNFTGVHAGLSFKPIEALSLGFSYRSKITSKLSGTTTSGPVSMDTRTECSSPHTFKLGSAVTITPSFLVALDLKYAMYSNSNKKQVVTMTLPNGSPMETSTDMSWKDVMAMNLGGEYLVAPSVPVRLGYGLTTSATPEATANPTMLPPGLIHAFHAGTGVRLTHLDLDLGGLYAFGSKEATPTAAFPGTYKMSSMIISLSATYRM